mmetsp:Transcript_13157/g.22285  ORF Transcript_13157/g.22285 Transcript_13157/m.22285 type:complete len:129 (-) Transcript_13157:44-430(-)
MEPVYFTYVTSWIYSFSSAIHLMPIMILACEMCPKEVEATFYSFVLALINVGYLASYQFGAFLIHSLGIRLGSYEKLSELILIASLYPLLSLPLMYCLLPSQRVMNQQFSDFRAARTKSKEAQQMQLL